MRGARRPRAALAHVTQVTLAAAIAVLLGGGAAERAGAALVFADPGFVSNELPIDLDHL